MIRAALKYNRGRRRADVRPVPGQSCLWGLGRSAEGANHAGAVVAWREMVLQVWCGFGPQSKMDGLGASGHGTAVGKQDAQL